MLRARIRESDDPRKPPIRTAKTSLSFVHRLNVRVNFFCCNFSRLSIRISQSVAGEQLSRESPFWPSSLYERVCPFLTRICLSYLRVTRARSRRFSHRCDAANAGETQGETGCLKGESKIRLLRLNKIKPASRRFRAATSATARAFAIRGALRDINDA